MSAPVSKAISVAEVDGEIDELTLARARRGDADASARLVRRYERRVFALLWRMMGHLGAPAVEDAAQEVFLGAFRGLDRFSASGAARLSTWILTIAARRAIDELRRAHPTESTEALAGQASPLTADASLRTGDLARALVAAVSSLSPEMRAAFLLREYHDFDYESIAVALGIEAGTVKSRLARARASVRAAIDEVRHDR